MSPEYPDWRGETAFILGGGESLKGFDPVALRGHKVIAVNEAGLTLCPWADVLFWADIRWVGWNLHRMGLHTGPYRYTCQNYMLDRIPGAQLLRFAPTVRDDPYSAFSFRPDTVAGLDSGGRCINLAFHTGARRVVLLGFDMHDYRLGEWQRGSWHGAHKEPPLAAQRTNRFVPAHEIMADFVHENCPEFGVLNATPGSALTCWPMVNLEDVI